MSLYLVILCFVIPGALHASPPAETPDFDVVADAVERYFASQPGHEANDLLRQSQVAGVLKSVAQAGWNVGKAQAQAIIDLALPDKSFLIRESDSPAGKRFMRQVASHPGGYSHLDRLSTTPRGESMIRYLISKPGGSDLITYMATTEGGHNLSSMMADVRGGVNLNKPTRRIYTEAELLTFLKLLYDDVNQQPSR